MKYSVKKGDNVLVLAGKDAGKTGEVLEVNRESGRVIVSGINIQAHHKKPRSKDDKGGILKTEGAIDVSNVQIICPVCKKATRVSHSIVGDEKSRICKKCGASLDVAKSKKATKKVETSTAKKAQKAEKTEVIATKKTTKTASEKKVQKSEKIENTTTKKTAKSSKKA